MSREAVDQTHLDEWNKQFGGSEEDKKETPETEVDEVEELEEVEEEPEQEEPEREEPAQEKEPETESAPEDKEPPRKKTQDDEYREFIDQAPDGLKDKARKIVQALKSADGRTSALQRRLNAREQLINQLYQQSPQPQSKESSQTPTSRSDKQKDSDPTPADELPARFKALKEKNPEAADIIDEIAKFHSDKTAKQIQDIIDSRLGKIEQNEKRAQAQQELTRLEERTKDLFAPYGMTARDVMGSDDFRAWIEIQRAEAPGIYKLYQQAEDANTAAVILEKYEQDYQQAAREAGLLDDEDNNQPSHNKGDEIRQKREKSKASGRSPKPARAGTPAKGRGDLDYNEEWKLMWGGK